ncbi:HET domain-containing protein [Fusarium sp. LHS14.1]|nr:HET domain-containing protein [Fusarium sp. LHS14.1]
MAPPTIYSKTLLPNEIRLMVLLPGKWKDPVSCELCIDLLLKKSRRREYKALSYAWGLESRSNPPKIQVDGMLIPITVNLDCALRHIRSPCESVVLWVDALCINQADAKERMTQVLRMADIYSEATEVIVFLGGSPGRQMKVSKKQKDPGPCTVFTNTPLDDTLTNQALLNWTTPGRRQQITAFDLFCLLRILSQSREASDPFKVLREVPDVYLTAIFEGLRQMLTTRWWDRIWVVQEAVIAKKITLRYGDVSAPWEMAAEAALTHFQRDRNDHVSPVSRDDIKVLNLLSRVQDIDNFRRTWGENDRPNILSLLRDFSNRKASDERDKVYALLGLCDQHTGIRPDYSSEVRETYMLATIDIILHSQSLSVLTGDLGRKERRDLPSWVPDWSATFDEHDRKRVRLFNHYNACGNVKGNILKDDTIGRHIEVEMANLAMNLERSRDTASLPPRSLSTILKWYKSAHPKAEMDCDRHHRI